MSHDFNHLLAVDLMKIEGEWALKMVDMFSRYAVVELVPDKTAASLVAAVDRRWVTYFGPPKAILSDPGGENTGERTLEYFAALSAKTMTTATNSPRSNGVCERLGAIIGETVARL